MPSFNINAGIPLTDPVGKSRMISVFLIRSLALFVLATPYTLSAAYAFCEPVESSSSTVPALITNSHPDSLAQRSIVLETK